MAYAPLNKAKNLIRLLHLSPGPGEIKCRFSIASLDDGPRYEALSYVWGNTNDTRPINFDTHTIPVTKNLHAALRNLQFNSQDRILWVDALCVNQADLDERMNQVSLMGAIYQQATSVVVWLGNAWPGSETAMDFLRMLGEDKDLHLNPVKQPSICIQGLHMDSQDLCRYLIELFNVPWWTRLWTVQEFVLAQQLVFQCGKTTLCSDLMQKAMDNFWAHRRDCCLPDYFPDEELEATVAQSFSQKLGLDTIAKERQSFLPYSALSAMSLLCKRQATDPRDKVYGILGLGTGPYANLLNADYTLSPEQVCHAAVIKSVERTGKLEFLSHLYEHSNRRLPSFTPNWTGAFDWSEHYGSRLAYLPMFNASGGRKTELKVMSERMICLPGVVFDTIVTTALEVGDVYQLEFLRELYSLAPPEKDSELPYCHSNDSLSVAFLRTMCGGVEWAGNRGGTRYCMRMSGSTDLDKISRWKTWITAPARLQGILFDFDVRNVANLLTDIQNSTYGRRFFMTAKGYFGFGPGRCRRGDLVVVLDGGNMPYIIRPVSPEYRLSLLEQGVGQYPGDGEILSRDWYTILGDSYVHGIMDGEVFNMLEETEKQLQDIILV